MRAWELGRPGPIDSSPLELADRPIPNPGPREVRIQVSACGVCRTDLHLAEGDLAPRRPGVVPGHEVVGTVDALGDGARRFGVGDRIGIPWLRWTCGVCRFCLRGDENLCLDPRFTGWDEDGGYAEYAVIHEDFAYLIPDKFDDERAAPLLCAGIIGYRALTRCSLPPSGRLGIYGFGGSAHIAAQVALFEGATVHVMTRSKKAQDLARSLGIDSVRGSHDPPPERLDAAILFAPAGDLVPVAMSALDRGATLAVAGIHLSNVPSLVYQTHLFHERKLVSVTANTRRDGEEFLRKAAEIPIDVTTVAFQLEAAVDALQAMAHGELAGAAVLKVD